MCESLCFWTVGDKKNILNCTEGSISKIKSVFFMNSVWYDRVFPTVLNFPTFLKVRVQS